MEDSRPGNSRASYGSLKAPLHPSTNQGALLRAAYRMKSFDEFFTWCESHGLKTDRRIATAFGMTSQTVRNWKAARRASGTKPKKWVALACSGYEAVLRTSLDEFPSFPAVSVEWFDIWRTEQRLDTLELAGSAFGVTRQAVHAWRKRERLPRWLPLACVGFQVGKSPAPIPTSSLTDATTSA